MQIDGISGYDEDQVALIAHSSAEFAHHVPITLGTPTTVGESESEIDMLATLWACVRKNTLLRAAATWVSVVRADVAMKPIDVTGYEEPIQLLASEVAKPFEMLVMKASENIPPFLKESLCKVPKAYTQR